MASYSYYEKGTYYFRKGIHRKYLRDKNQTFNFRISLKKTARSFYFILEKDHQELSKLTNYINERLDIILSHKAGDLEVNDLITYVNDICEEYRKIAVIENSSLEMKRVEALEYIDAEGIKQGYGIQAISRKYKQIIDQYDNLTTNIDKTFELGNEILKRSNITKDQLLEVKPNQMQTFYEMLIKAEKSVLENDIKVYISRNFSQFTSLVLDNTQSLEEKITQAYYEYLEVVRDNDLQIDYIKFIKSKRTIPIATSSKRSNDELLDLIMKELKKEEETKSLENTVDFDYLVSKYTEFKNSTDKISKAARNSLLLLKSFLTGNGKDFKTKQLSSLNEEDFINFEKVLIELPNNAVEEIKKGRNVFDLVEYRQKSNGVRYTVNAIYLKESHIKEFLKYICKRHKNIGLDRDLIDLLSVKNQSKIIKSEEGEEDPNLRAFTSEELNIFLNNSFNKEKLKSILIDRPTYFYCFFISLFLGLRQEEALLITMNDIKVQEFENERYYYIYLNENENFQHLKNKNAHRNIAIPTQLIELGFLNYLNIRHKKKEKTVFYFSSSGGGSMSVFFKRRLTALFPDRVDNKENRQTKVLDNYIQYRSLRKNFSNFLFEENRTRFDTPTNKYRIMGHENEESKSKVTKDYLQRLEPKKAFEIISAINYEETLDLTEIKKAVQNHYKNILTDLNWLKEKSNEEWKLVSKVRPKRGRKV